MESLKSCEILDELGKFGITPSPELIQYVLEYASYYSLLSYSRE